MLPQRCRLYTILRGSLNTVSIAELLSEAPQTDARLVESRSASNACEGSQCDMVDAEIQCVNTYVSGIKRCHDDWQRCLGTSMSYWRFLRCSGAAIVCIEATEAEYRACMAEVND